jgi:hypothetical protein
MTRLCQCISQGANPQGKNSIIVADQQFHQIPFDWLVGLIIWLLAVYLSFYRDRGWWVFEAALV